MFNYKRIAFFMLFLIASYGLWIIFRPASIVRVDNGAVFVEHLPMTTKGKLDWWLKNKNFLQSSYRLISNPDNFTVTIMNFGGYKELPKGTRDGSIDDYTCFEDINGGYNKCVYNDIAVIIRGSINGKVFINIGDKTYIQTPDGKTSLK